MSKDSLHFPKRNFGDGLLMVSAAFWSDVWLQFQFHSCKINSTSYARTLEINFVLFMTQSPTKTKFSARKCFIPNIRFFKNWFNTKNTPALEWSTVLTRCKVHGKSLGDTTQSSLLRKSTYESLNLRKNGISQESSNIDQNIIKTLVKSVNSGIFNLLKYKGVRITK